MDNVKELLAVPGRPYDNLSGTYDSMYDKMPYVWDADLILEKRITKESGNVIKSYRCLMKEPFEVKHE